MKVYSHESVYWTVADDVFFSGRGNKHILGLMRILEFLCIVFSVKVDENWPDRPKYYRKVKKQVGRSMWKIES
jgi:hypothetical protein